MPTSQMTTMASARIRAAAEGRAIERALAFSQPHTRGGRSALRMWSVCSKRDLGTMGTVRTMVPTVGGSRALQDHEDQSWTIISMSRATPEKKEEVASSLGQFAARGRRLRVFHA